MNEDLEKLKANIPRVIEILTNKNITPIDQSTLIIFMTLEALGKNHLLKLYNEAVSEHLEELNSKGTLDYQIVFNGNGNLGTRESEES